MASSSSVVDISTVARHPTTHLYCNFCLASKPGLLRCSGCQCVRYCDQEHQLINRESHKRVCNRIKKLKANMEKEERELRNHPGDSMMPENPFENCVGLFWGIHETRDYMRARIAYVTEFYNMRTFDAANNALTHFLDMLRLNRGDNQGVRGIIPGLYLRLCRDQECYDFVKWWVQKHYESNYDWGDDTLPYLDLKNEDVMEDPELFCGRFVPCGMTISATLIKLRIMLDLQGIRNTESKENDTKTFRSSILSSRPELKELEGLDERIKLLEAQTDKLFTNVHRLNKHFWKGLLDHKSLMDQPLGLYSMGDSSEMVMLVQYFAWTWVETDGAIDWVKKRLPRIERNGYSI